MAGNTGTDGYNEFSAVMSRGLIEAGSGSAGRLDGRGSFSAVMSRGLIEASAATVDVAAVVDRSPR